GLQKGASIISVEGTPIVYFDHFTGDIKDSANRPISLELIRAGNELPTTGQLSADGMLGFGMQDDPSMVLLTREYSLAEAFPVGVNKAFAVITDNIKGFGKIFKGEVRADKALSGPVGIAKLFGTDVDWFRFWNLVGMLSMALAFMNLLPIPA